MRQRLLLGNWKMYKAPSEAKRLAEALKAAFAKPCAADRVAVFPPAVSITEVSRALAGSSIAVGAQNVHWEKEGAYTGEISAPFAKDAGCAYALVGHSERRQYFGETDESANKRVKAVIAAGLTAVLCVGETLQERDAGETEAVVARQLRAGLAGIASPERVVIAYEPVWAIGTGRVATPAQAEEVHAQLRRLLSASIGAEVPILYGGSVKPDNAAGLLAEPNIDGALVGGASLDAAGFYAIGSAFTPRSPS